MKNAAAKRIFAIFCTAFMLLPMLASCNGEGEGGSSLPFAEESLPDADVVTVSIDGREYALRDKIDSESTEDGVYIYTRNSGKTAVPKINADDNRFFDAAVLDGVVVDVADSGSSAVIPEDGFVIRFRGVDDAKIKIGDKVECPDIDLTVFPESYVKFGDIYIEIGYKNAERTAEDTGWLYNEYWYNGNTESNIYCTEIAVQDGRIIDINRSGDNKAGMGIPKGGYVLVVGENSVNEHKAERLNVGDEAVLVEGEKLYTSKHLNIAGSNINRPDDGIVLFNGEKQNSTPAGSNLTELIVNSDGRIAEICTDCSGMNKIPEGGFVVSASGISAKTLARAATAEAQVIKVGPRFINIVTTPLTELARLISERESVLEGYKRAVQNLDRIDFEKEARLISDMSGNIAKAEATLGISSDTEYNGYDGTVLAEAVSSLFALSRQARDELVPYITVQDRMAWVTVGEYDYNNQIVLHYKTAADIDHTVAYAKYCGLNTLIIDNTVCGFAVYESGVAGMVKYPKLGDLDVIKAFKDSCDKNGIRLIVMVNAFSSGLEGVIYPENHYMSIYKDKYLLTNKGNHAGPEKVITLDPADKDVQAFNLAVVSEIAEKYDIFGIQADYMRYPLPYYYQEHNYEDFGYNESTVSEFVKKYGKNPATLKISDPLWEKWCAFRRDIISDYQKSFYQTVKEINPRLHVSFTCFADYRDRQIYTYQDVEKWAENGFADAVFPMIYGETTEYQQKYAEEILPITKHTQLILGVGTYVKATQKSLEEQFIMPYNLCAEGISVFTLRYISTCGYDKTVRNAFRVAATPTTAPEAELIKASAEMITKRIESLLFAARFSGSLAESEGESLKSLTQTVNSACETAKDFNAFCAVLSVLRVCVESGEVAVPAAVKDAVLCEFDYVIGINN